MTPIDDLDRRDKRVGIRVNGDKITLLTAITDWTTTLGVPVRQWARNALLDAAGFQDTTRRRVSRSVNLQPWQGEPAQNTFVVPVSARERAAIEEQAGGNVSEWAWDVLVRAYRRETRRQQRKEGQQR